MQREKLSSQVIIRAMKKFVKKKKELSMDKDEKKIKLASFDDENFDQFN